MLLALDSATRQAGISLYDGEVVRAEALWSSSRVYHTEWLTPAIAQALERINATAADLSVVAVTTGPGSFTGLRVALSVAKGIAAARDLPIIGVPSLLVTAMPHFGASVAVVATLSAGRGRHAWQRFSTDATPEHWEASDPTIDSVKQLAERLVEDDDLLRIAGELTPAERAFLAERLGERARILSPALSVRRPSVLAELAWRRWQVGDVDDLHTLEPQYLRLATAS